MKTRIATLRSLTLVALPLALAACGDETGPGDIAAGTYTLRTINGEAPPTIIHMEQQDGPTFAARINSGRIALDDGAYDAELVFDILVDGDVFLAGQKAEDAGTYRVSGDRVTLTSSDPDSEPVTATLSGGTLTMSDHVEGFGVLELVFER